MASLLLGYFPRSGCGGSPSERPPQVRCSVPRILRLFGYGFRLRLGQRELSAQRLFDIKSHSYGSIGCTVEWLRGELDTSPEKLAAWECERMPAFLLSAYDAAAREGWKI